MIRNIFFLGLAFLSFGLNGAQRTVYIIVPGTWSSEYGWHSTGGDFFESLKNSVDQETTSVMTYYWSGKNNHKSREYAAQGLSNLIQSFAHDTILKLVTHSHGSNVGILASQLLTKIEKKFAPIADFYAFGTPVDPESYFPAMDVINYFYHFFSYSDFVQTVFNTFQRVYPDHPRIANISITVNHQQPNHGTIHHPLIAQWLPKLPACLHNFDFTKPGNIAFFSDKHPEYYIEHNRKELLEEDFYLTLDYILALQGKNINASKN